MPPPLDPGPRESVPPDLEGLIWQMLAKKPDARPQTMAEVVERLESVWAQARTGPYPKTATPRPVSTRVSASGRFAGGSQLGSAIQPLPDSGVMPAATRSGRQASPSGVRRAPSGSQAGQRPPSGRQEGLQEGLPTDPLGTYVDGDEQAPEAPLTPPKSKLPFVLIGLVLAGAAGTAGVLALKGPSEPAKPPVVVELPPPTKPVEPVKEEPVKPSGPVQLSRLLKSEPAGAEVFKGDVLVGTTPFKLKGDKDSVLELTLKLNGYKPFPVKVGLDSESDLSLTLEKERAAAVVVPKKPKNDLAPDPYDVKQTEDLKDNPFK